MPLDKLGREYTPMTEAEKQAIRDRPFDFGPIARSAAMIQRRKQQKASEAPRVYVADERPATPAEKAPARRVNARRKTR